MNCGRLVLTVIVVGWALVSGSSWAAETEQQGKTNISVVAPATATEATAADANQVTGKIEFETTTQDFGAVAPGASQNCEFKFQNKGPGTLKITDISKTCGCTVFTLDKKDYAPGEAGVLKVQYNADRGAGVRTRHLYVFSNDKDNPRVELTIKATVVQKVVFEPDRIDFTLKGANVGVAELTVRSVDQQPFAITDFKSTADAVAAGFDPNKKETKFVLETKIDPAKMGIASNGRIEINTTHPECPQITVPFSVLPKFKVDPPAINVLNAEAEKPVQKELWVLSNYEEDFEVESAKAKEGVIKVVSQEKLGNRYKFNLEITPPPTKSSARMFTDTLTVAIKGGDKLDIACRGFYARK